MNYLPAGEFGVLASIIGLMMTTFLWLVRSSRNDLNKTNERWTSYMERTVDKQVEAMFTMTTGLSKLFDESLKHEDRAQRRYEQISEQARQYEEWASKRHDRMVQRMEGIEKNRKQVTELLDEVSHEVRKQDE